MREILEIYRAYGFRTQVLAASLRGPMHVLEAAKMGSHIGTMPFKVLEQLFHHPLTDRGLAGFLKDWEKARADAGRYSGAGRSRVKRRLEERSTRLAHLGRGRGRRGDCGWRDDLSVAAPSPRPRREPSANAARM